MVNHSTNSGAVPESKNLQQQDILPEVRMQRSALADPAKKRGQQSGKKRQRSGKKGQKQKSAKKNQKKSGKRQERKSRRRGQDKKNKVETKPAIAKQRMSGKQDTDFEFQACDYLDLVEVGYRQDSDYNCTQGSKFLFKAA